MSRSNGEVVVVVDPGSSSIKVGYGGDDIPTSIFPSSLTKDNLKLESLESFDGDPANFPINRGVVRDFDQMESLWGMITEEAGLSNMENMSVMLVESAKSNSEQREKWAELLFAKFNVPSICIGNSASLTMFAAGRTTGVAVECGAGLTSSVPVFEGLALSHAMLTMDWAGQDISKDLKNGIRSDCAYPFDPLEAKQLKERMAFISPHLRSELQHQQRDEFVSVSLPDGNEVSVAKSTFSDCTEKLMYNDDTHVSPNGGLVNQVYESLTLCDDSIRKDLMDNIIIAGGTSLLPG
jgi:actin